MLSFGDVFTAPSYPFKNDYFILLQEFDGSMYCMKVLTKDEIKQLHIVCKMLSDKGLEEDEHIAFCFVELTTRTFDGRVAGAKQDGMPPPSFYTQVCSLNGDDKRKLRDKLLGMKNTDVKDVLPKRLREALEGLDL